MAISLHSNEFKALASKIIHVLKYKLNKKTLAGFGIAAFQGSIKISLVSVEIME